MSFPQKTMHIDLRGLKSTFLTHEKWFHWNIYFSPLQCIVQCFWQKRNYVADFLILLILRVWFFCAKMRQHSELITYIIEQKCDICTVHFHYHITMARIVHFFPKTKIVFQNFLVLRCFHWYFYMKYIRFCAVLNLLNFGCYLTFEFTF